MLVIATLGILAIAVPLAWSFLVGQRYFWLWLAWAALSLVTAGGVHFLAPTTTSARRVGILFLYLVPYFFVTVFAWYVSDRRRLVAIAGPFVFAAGFLVALSLVVGLGFLQP